MSNNISNINIKDILNKYDAIFLDSYGVLIDGQNAIKGVDRFIDKLNKEKFNYYVLTNDSSVSTINRSRKFFKIGLKISPDKIISSGDLIGDFMIKRNLINYPSVVLGSAGTQYFISKTNIQTVSLSEITKSRSIIIGHSKSFNWEYTLNFLLNFLNHKVLNQEQYDIIFPNPDFIYPNGKSCYGFGSAAFGYLLENGFNKLHGDNKQIKFHKLGKPGSMIFQKAKKESKSNNPIMIGDQLETDILGGNNFGIDTALVLTGVDRYTLNQKNLHLTGNMLPKYILRSLM